MRLFLSAAIALTAACMPLIAQERAVVHKNGSATVTVNDPRPLAQAIRAAREEYGWVVDYEEPPWRSGDLRDTSPAAWHAAHPGVRGWMEPAGGAFQSSYAETPDMWSSTDEELQVLDKIVSDYDAGGNPGKFVVRAQMDGTYAVIGVSTEADNGSTVSASPYLDTPISITTAARSAQATLELILSAVSAKTGIVGHIGGGPLNLLLSTNLSVGGTDVPARDLLIDVFQAVGFKTSWDLWFLPNLQEYSLRLREAALAIPGPFGQTRLVPVSPTPSAGPGGPQ